MNLNQFLSLPSPRVLILDQMPVRALTGSRACPHMFRHAADLISENGRITKGPPERHGQTLNEAEVQNALWMTHEIAKAQVDAQKVWADRIIGALVE